MKRFPYPCASTIQIVPPLQSHDAWHTGDSSALMNPQSLSLAWSAPSSPTGYSTPVIDGNTIYAMQNQGGVAGNVIESHEHKGDFKDSSRAN
jgi:hypothetical protein